MSNSNVKTVTRQAFVKQFVNSGLSYEQAHKAYESMTQVFADAIVSGQKINVGKVLSVYPKKKDPRQVNMCFGGVKRTIHLGSRITYHCSVFKEFLNSHQLRWPL